jgi:GTP-binding protein HflX
VGYTNAGKTSLMNALTGESLSSRDRPFETLDTVSRSLSRHGEDVLLSDTVGFIRRLPERLLASFETTLAEVREASLLALVVDISDYEWSQHLQITTELLERLGAGDAPRFFIFNKIDLLPQRPARVFFEKIANDSPFAVVSSLDEASVAQLREALLKVVREEQEERTLFVPYSETVTLNQIYGGCRVIETESLEGGLRLTFQGPSGVVGRIESSLEART